ncbi:MAG: YkgJ family cysteine cluster protein [Pseudomonadota bacterium]
MREIDNLKQAILKEYPRLTEESGFTFSCHKGVSCFNRCCADINIFLTPYDIVRMKSNLGISSGDFLSKYTLAPFDENLKYPVVLLKMEDNERKSCPFVTEEGCSVYADRPWACRMYPLGLASPAEGSKDLDKEFYFILKEPDCMGFEEKKDFTVAQWLDDQGIAGYNEMGREFKELTLHRYFSEGNNLSPDKVEMFFTACYHLDRFKDFLFKSSFFDKFDVDDETRDRIGKDDVELMKFGNRWLRFALFAEKTLPIKEDVLAREKHMMDITGGR